MYTCTYTHIWVTDTSTMSHVKASRHTCKWVIIMSQIWFVTHRFNVSSWNESYHSRCMGGMIGWFVTHGCKKCKWVIIMSHIYHSYHIRICCVFVYTCTYTDTWVTGTSNMSHIKHHVTHVSVSSACHRDICDITYRYATSQMHSPCHICRQMWHVWVSQPNVAQVSESSSCHRDIRDIA